MAQSDDPSASSLPRKAPGRPVAGRSGPGWTVGPLGLLAALWGLSAVGCSQAVERQQIAEEAAVAAVKFMTEQTGGKIVNYELGGLCVLAGLVAGVLLTVGLQRYYRRRWGKVIANVHKTECN